MCLFAYLSIFFGEMSVKVSGSLVFKIFYFILEYSRLTML